MLTFPQSRTLNLMRSWYNIYIIWLELLNTIYSFRSGKTVHRIPTVYLKFIRICPAASISVIHLKFCSKSHHLISTNLFVINHLWQLFRNYTTIYIIKRQSYFHFIETRLYRILLAPVYPLPSKFNVLSQNQIRKFVFELIIRNLSTWKPRELRAYKCIDYGWFVFHDWFYCVARIWARTALELK